MLRSDIALQPGQKLLVQGELGSLPPAGPMSSGPGVASNAAMRHAGPLLAACIGGTVLAVGAMRLWSAAPKATAEIATAAPTLLIEPAVPAAVPATVAAASTPAAAAPPAPVLSAVSEVRALLQDAAVEIHAVESALAAIRRAARASAAAAAASASAAAPGAATAAVAAIGVSATAVAVLEPPARGPSLADAETAEAPPPHEPFPAPAEPSPEATVPAPVSDPWQSAATGVDGAVEGVGAAVSEQLAETSAAAGLAAAVAAPPGASPVTSPTSTVASVDEAPAAPSLDQAEGQDTGTEAEGEPVPWSTFDTATQVAAARARVQTALEAAYGLMLSVPVKEDAAAPAAAAAAPPVPESQVNQPAGAEGHEAAPAQETPAAAEATGPAQEAGLAAAESAAEAAVPGVPTQPTAEVVEPTAVVEPTEVVEGVEALAVLPQPGERPMDTTSAGQVLDRIRVINRLLEQEQERAAAAADEGEADTAEAAAAAAAAQAAPTPAERLTAAPATKATDAAALTPAAVSSAKFLPLNGGTVEYEQPVDIASDRERAQGLLDKIDVLLASFETLDLDDDEQQPAGFISSDGAASAPPTPALNSVDQLLPPLAASVTPAVDLSAALSSTDSTTTAKLVLKLPPATGPTEPTEAPPTAPSPTSSPTSSPAVAPVLSRSGLEELVRPLGTSVASEVLDRIRDIGKLLEEEVLKQQLPQQQGQRQEQQVAQLQQQAQTAAAAAAVGAAVAAANATQAAETAANALGALAENVGAAAAEGAAAATAAAIVGVTSVPSAILSSVNRAIGASPPAPSAGAPSLPPSPGSVALLERPHEPATAAMLPPAKGAAGMLSGPPSRVALPPAPPLPPTPPASPPISPTTSWTEEDGAWAQNSEVVNEASRALLAQIRELSKAVAARAPAPPQSASTPPQVPSVPPRAPRPPQMPPPAAPAPPPVVNPVVRRAAAAAAATVSGSLSPDWAAARSPPPPPPPRTSGAAAGSGVGGGDASLVHLKSGLLDLVYGTARGVSATSTQRAAIDEFVTALEARNPNSMATEAVSALAGRWKLVYTSNVGTLLLLGALDGMPLVDVGDVYQIIDPETLTATNKIDLAVPMLLSLRAEAGLEVRSPRQFKVRFTRVGLDTYLVTPQIMAALEVPESVTVLGATLDLTPLKKLVEPLNSGIEAAQGLLGRAISPELAVDSVPVPPGLSPGTVTEAASLWMLTTYLDDNLRISRDDEGRVFVMLKDVGIYPDDVPSKGSPR